MDRYLVFVGSLAVSSRAGGTVTSPLHIVWPASVLVSWLYVLPPGNTRMAQKGWGIQPESGCLLPVGRRLSPAWPP